MLTQKTFLEEISKELKKQLKRYGMHVQGFDFDDLVQEAACRVVETGSSVENACATVRRRYARAAVSFNRELTEQDREALLDPEKAIEDFYVY